jgi:hypothetical protein
MTPPAGHAAGSHCLRKKPIAFVGVYSRLKPVSDVEELFPGLSGVFNLQTSFLPTSGRLADGLGSIVQNNGLPASAQTTHRECWPVRAAAAAQLSSNGDGSRDVVQGQLGLDYFGVSLDAIYGHVKDAVSAAPLAVGFAPTAAELASAGSGLVAGTVSDNTGLMLLVSYLIGPVKLYAGYENIQFAIRPTHCRLAHLSSVAIRSAR